MKTVGRAQVTKERLQKLLDEHGTYVNVGRILGVTRERVRQLARLLNIDPDYTYRHKIQRQRSNDALYPAVIQKLVGEYVSFHECARDLKICIERIREVLGPSRVFVDLVRSQRGEMISKNIEIVRRLQNITQCDLAREMHQKPSSISTYENQNSLRVMISLRRYANALGVPVAFFIEPMTYQRIKQLRKMQVKPTQSFRCTLKERCEGQAKDNPKICVYAGVCPAKRAIVRRLK
jgi:hypothetical protein